MANKNIP